MKTEKGRNYDIYEDIDDKEEPVLHSFVEDDNFIVLEKSIIRTLQLTKYLDNGYTNNFYADTEITLVTEVNSEGKVTKETIEEIKVDEETEETIDDHISGCIKNCIVKTIFDECLDTLDDEKISLLGKMLEYKGINVADLECGECDTLGMKKSWIERVRYG